MEKKVEEKDVIKDALEELLTEEGYDGRFFVNGKELSARELLTELQNDTEIGYEFRKDVTKTIISYLMKFGQEGPTHK